MEARSKKPGNGRTAETGRQQLSQNRPSHENADAVEPPATHLPRLGLDPEKTASPPKRERIAAYDIARGIAIILVVYGHCLRGLTASGLVSQESPLQVSDYTIYTFHMPLFFVISGFFFRRDAAGNHRARWLARLKTLVYPYFFWSLLHGGLLVAASGSGATNNNISLSRLEEILWAPIAPYWFLYALFVAFTLLDFVPRMNSRWLVLSGFFAFALFYAVAPTLPFDLAYGFLYICVGIWMREEGLMRRIPASFAAVFLLWAAFAILTALALTLGVPERWPLLSAITGTIAVLSSSLWLERVAPRAAVIRCLELLGQCSMGIFVLHIIVLGIVRLALTHALKIDDATVLLIAGTVIGVLLPALVQIIAIRLGIQSLVALPSSAKLFVRQAGSPTEANK
jgi:fucose 4-O-acetylase-like acetyltransferase